MTPLLAELLYFMFIIFSNKHDKYKVINQRSFYLLCKKCIFISGLHINLRSSVSKKCTMMFLHRIMIIFYLYEKKAFLELN